MANEGDNACTCKSFNPNLFGEFLDARIEEIQTKTEKDVTFKGLLETMANECDNTCTCKYFNPNLFGEFLDARIEEMQTKTERDVTFHRLHYHWTAHKMDIKHEMKPYYWLRDISMLIWQY